VFRTATTVVVEHRTTLSLPGGDIREVRPGDELTFAVGDPVPEVSGVATDAVVVLLPGVALGDGLTGRLLAALVAAGGHSRPSSPPRPGCSPASPG
jgi:hypothetical protein